MALSANNQIKQLIANPKTKAVLAKNGLPVDDPSFLATDYMKISTMTKIPGSGFGPEFMEKINADIQESYRDYTKVIQIGCIVKDSEKALAAFLAVFPGIPDQYVCSTDLINGALHMSFNGEMKECNLHNTLINYQHIQIEFIQPLDNEDNFYMDYLKRTGGGLHHICLVSEDIEATIDALKAYGLEIVSEGEMYGCRVVFFKMAESNLLLELCEATSEASSEIPFNA